MTVGIRDITGVVCPMGCGPTLHLMQNGVIVCLSPDCPVPTAAHQILSDPETMDVVEFTSHGFTVLHPLRERLGSLFACPVTEACAELEMPEEGWEGRYRASIGPGGQLQLEEIADSPQTTFATR